MLQLQKRTDSYVCGANLNVGHGIWKIALFEIVYTLASPFLHRPAVYLWDTI